MTNIEREIYKIYKKVYSSVFTPKAVTALSKKDRDEILRNIGMLQSSKKYDEFAKKFAAQLAKKGLMKKRGVWRKYYAAAKAAHHIVLPTTYSEFEQIIFKKMVLHNFEMIKSIPAATMNIVNHKYSETLINEVVNGTRTRGSFAKELASHGYKQANLIARTETAKLQSAIMENRATSLGLVAYEWISSNDKRTRKSHKNMNGVIVFYRSQMEKPLLDGIYGNAGEFPNCRCSMEPVVDVEDLIKSTYKVYDYRTQKVISMTRKELVNALERGEL